MGVKRFLSAKKGTKIQKRGMPLAKAFLIRGNAWPHASTQQELQYLKWAIFGYPHSPDLAPSDFDLLMRNLEKH